jgi:hypothetical protein
MTIFEEQKGIASMRRFLAFLSFSNAAALSWFDTSWQIIGLWILAGLVLLGLTTVQEIKSVTQYKLADAVGGGSVGGEAEEPIGFKGQ